MKKWWMEILTFQFSSILFYTHLSAISWEAKRLRCVNRIYSRNCWEQRSNLSYIVYTNDRTDDSIPILYENILTRLTKSEESHRFCESHRFLRIIFFFKQPQWYFVICNEVWSNYTTNFIVGSRLLFFFFFKNSHMEEVGCDIFILNSDWRVINPCHSSRAIRRREGRFPLSLVPSFIYTILLLISQLSTWVNVSHVSTYFSHNFIHIDTWFNRDFNYCSYIFDISR